jgi:glycosyltransferase involved in cell wall biosynthesis
MPSRADCTPVAVSEANAFGVPCLASLVGGFPTIIEDGVNGYLFPPDTIVENCCRVIQRMRGDVAECRRLALSSFRMYQSRLNWCVATERVAAILDKAIRQHADGGIRSAQGR